MARDALSERDSAVLAVKMPVAGVRTEDVLRLQNVTLLVAQGLSPEDACIQSGFSKAAWLKLALNYPEAYDYILRVNALLRSTTEMQVVTEMGRRLTTRPDKISDRDLAAFHASVKDERPERGVEITVDLGGLF